MQNTDNKIFTIGHGNRGIDIFLNLLVENDIQLLIDVRTTPYSRFHPQFRQSNLKVNLEHSEIAYLWLGNELGGRPKDPALYFNSEVNYSAIKETELFKSGIQEVLTLAATGIKVTLMCSESDPNECHRKHLIADELINKGFQIIHIDKIGKLEIHINSKLF